MSLLERHLDQICLSSESIATLPFPPPKIFTNALLTQHDITSLIRDTEPHERALFSVPPPQPPTTAQTPYPDPKPSNRRQTVFNVASGEVTTGSGPSARGPRRNTAVAAVLGPELHSQVRKSEGPQGKGDVNVEVLLRGAEKLNNVYSIPGVPDRIHSLRTRHGQLQNSLAHYETKVARQTRELQRMNKGDSWDGSGEEDEDREAVASEETELEVTDEDLRREEEEIAELERKKKELEDRVSGMERDLGVAMIQNNPLFQGINLQMVSNIHIILTALEALRSGGPLPLLTPSIASAIGTIRANMANNPLLGEIIDAVLALPRATVDDALVAGRIIHDFLMDMTLRPGTPDYGAAVAALRIFQPVPRPGLLSGPEDLVILSRSVPVRHHEHERGPSTLGLTSSRERGSGRGATQPSREREPGNQGNIVSLGERYVAQRRSGIGRGNDLRPSGQGRLASNFSTAEELARNQQTVERLQLENENENENENDENEDERFILESRRDIAGISRGTDSPTPAAEDEDEDDLEEKAEEGSKSPTTLKEKAPKTKEQKERHRRKRPIGELGYPDENFDRDVAKVGQPDESKLTVRLPTMRRDPNNPSRWIPGDGAFFRWSNRQCDWDNPNSVKALNSWRSQIFLRSLPPVRKTRQLWLRIEQQFVLDMIREQLIHNRSPKWIRLTNAYNRHFHGTHQRIGEEFVSPLGHKGGSHLKNDRLGPWRTSTAIKGQFKKWPEGRKLIADALDRDDEGLSDSPDDTHEIGDPDPLPSREVKKRAPQGKKAREARERRLEEALKAKAAEMAAGAKRQNVGDGEREPESNKRQKAIEQAGEDEHKDEDEEEDEDEDSVEDPFQEYFDELEEDEGSDAAEVVENEAEAAEVAASSDDNLTPPPYDSD